MSGDEPWQPPAEPEADAPSDHAANVDIADDPGPTPVAKLLLSLLGPAAVIALRSLTLIDLSDVALDYSVTVADVGLAPVVSAFMLVEIFALLIPAWRKHRIGGAAGRAKLAPAIAVLAVVLTLVQSGLIWFNLEQFRPTPFFLTIFGLAGGTAVLAMIAYAIDRAGIGSGYAVILVSGAVIPELEALPAVLAAAEAAPPGMVAAAGLPIWIGTFTWLLASGRLKSSVESPARLPFPVSGSQPLVWSAALIHTVVIAGWFAESPPGGDLYLVASLATTLIFTGVFAWLFNQPDRTAALVARSTGADREAAHRFATRSLTSGIRVCLLFFGGLALFEMAKMALHVETVLSTISAVAMAMLLMDVIDEVGALSQQETLVAVWPEQRPYAAGIAIDALRREGIYCFASSLRYRSLLQFFGPMVPIRLMVPKARAEEATRILSRVLLEP